MAKSSWVSGKWFYPISFFRCRWNKIQNSVLSGTSHIGLGAPSIEQCRLGFSYSGVFTLCDLRGQNYGHLNEFECCTYWGNLFFFGVLKETRYDKGDPKQPKFLWTNIQNLGQDGDWGCNSFRKEILRRKKTSGLMSTLSRMLFEDKEIL